MEKTFRVIKIIDDKHLVINAGKNDKVNIGDIFEIYEIGDEVIDPETNESLGILTSTKAEVKVTSLYSKMAVCESNEPYTALDTKSIILTTNKTLNVDISQISGGISTDQEIKIGDKVRKLNC